MTAMLLHFYRARPEGRRILSPFNEERFGSFCDFSGQAPATHLRQRQGTLRDGAAFFGILKTTCATTAALQRTPFVSIFP
jgi:hypothetical protein